MDIGAAIFPTHDAIGPAEVARLAEERGHESLFFPEHTHIPASRLSPYPGGGEMPRRYAHTFDLFVAVNTALTATSRLRVGSGICLVIERDPIVTAKQVASVDYLSGRRFEFGVGAGWNREEMANHGTDPRRRMALGVAGAASSGSAWRRRLPCSSMTSRATARERRTWVSARCRSYAATATGTWCGTVRWSGPCGSSRRCC